MSSKQSYRTQVNAAKAIEVGVFVLFSLQVIAMHQLVVQLRIWIQALGSMPIVSALLK